jgi:Ala-tRNA(Pro) deacylase
MYWEVRSAKPAMARRGEILWRVSFCGRGARALPPNMTTPATPADLFGYLDRLGIEHSTVSHPPLFTVEQSRALRGQIPGRHTKNLFLKTKRGGIFLLVLGEDTPVNLKQLHRKLGADRFSFGSAELLRETLGVEPGSVTPFAVINDTERRVAVVLDAEMMQHEVLNYHPLVNTLTISIKSGDLVQFLRATGHEPRILPLGDEPTDDLAP